MWVCSIWKLLKMSAVIPYPSSNTVAEKKSHDLEAKQYEKTVNEKLFPATVFEFVYVITAHIFTMSIGFDQEHFNNMLIQAKIFNGMSCNIYKSLLF